MKLPPAVSRRHAAYLILDILTALAAYAAAFLLRFEFALDSYHLSCLILTAPVAVLAYLPASYYYGVNRGLGYSANLGDAADVFKAACFASFVQGLISVPATDGRFPRSVLLLWPILTWLGTAGLRSLALFVRRLRLLTLLRGGRARTAVIVGVGELGEFVYQSLRSDPTCGYRVAAFFDDDQSMWGARLHGARVVGGVKRIGDFLRRVQVDEIVIAVGEARGGAVAAVAEAVQAAEKRPMVRIMPTLKEMLKGSSRSRLRRVRPADLLNRRVASLDTEGIGRSIEGKVVLVTGAGGTIGGELCRQVLLYKPSKLVLLENHATALFYLESEFREKHPSCEVVGMLGDVRDEAMLDRAFRVHRSEVVFHAAAHKHVHQLETNVLEGVSNNLLGTYRLACAADRHGVESFILISTDKAVRPSCVMGATKRAAELVISNLALTSRTRFAAVRFGNVLGSSGSVLNIFQEQIENGQPITLTHPEATRYFMTVEEAVGLVLQASALSKGGEIFMLKMGDPVRIMDLARNLILLSGLEAGRDIEIRMVGLKPGEKMNEELVEAASGEQSEHPEILVLRSENRRVEALGAMMSALEGRRQDAADSDMIHALSQMVPTFTASHLHIIPPAEAPAPAPAGRADWDASREERHALTAAEL